MKNKLFVIFFLILNLTTVRVFCQTNISEEQELINSLKLQLKEAKTDTTIFSLNMQIGEMYLYTIPDTALFYFNITKQRAENLISKNENTKDLKKIKEQLAWALYDIGYVYSTQGDISDALGYFKKSLNIQEKINDKSGLASSLFSIAGLYNSQGDISNALVFYNKAIKEYKETNDKYGLE